MKIDWANIDTKDLGVIFVRGIINAERTIFPIVSSRIIGMRVSLDSRKYFRYGFFGLLIQNCHFSEQEAF